MNESISKRGNSIKEDWSQRIILYVNTFLSSPENRLWREKDEPAWGEPLVGFARGDDQIFEEFKEYVGPFHWTPLEIFNLSFPRQDVQADEL
ncbi:MAG: hypothetical protein JW884_12440, partial [Deltaproteobacteria bacterium]|nr:hypothetical protein [Deltaproteobacteria bacterium]